MNAATAEYQTSKNVLKKTKRDKSEYIIKNHEKQSTESDIVSD